MLGVFVSVCLSLQSVQSMPAGVIHPSIFEGDTWYYVLSGQQILKTHTWPTRDTSSFTAHGNDFIEYEWLGEVVWAVTNRLGGLRALTGLLIALAAAITLLLYYYAALRSGNSKAAFAVCIPMLPLASTFFSLRPQLLGYVFLLLTMICLEHFRQGRERAIWFLPPIFLLWVNTHGSFILGLGVLGVYGASGLMSFRWGSLEAVPWTRRQRHRLAMVALLSVMALVVTPYGARLAVYPMQYTLHSSLGFAHIVEYQALGASGSALNLFLALLLLFVLAQITLHPTYRVEEIVLFLLAIYGAWVHVRLLVLFVFVFAPILATLLARWAPRYDARKDHPFLNAALMLLIATAVVRFFPSNQELKKVIACAFPSGAAEYLKHYAVPEPMFNDDFWGDYLVRTLGPERTIFIDGRSQLYEEAGVLADYLKVINLEPGTQLVLRKYGINSCLIERDSALATLLAASPGWRPVYYNKLSVLFVRTQALRGNK